LITEIKKFVKVCRDAALMPMRIKLLQEGGFNKLKKDDLDQLQGI